MATKPIIIDSQPALSKFIGDIREQWASAKFLRVTVKTGRDRSLDFNALSHVWYAQLAAELREYDAAGWKRFCKLHAGVPILEAEDADFRATMAALKHLTYEQKVKAMDFIDVTSLMTQDQFSRYMHAVQECFQDPANYVDLQFPVKELGHGVGRK